MAPYGPAPTVFRPSIVRCGILRRWLTALLHPVRSPRPQLAFWQSKDREVNQIRVEAMTSLLDELEAFRIDLNHYYGDLEPQGVIDAVLTGKIDSLRAFCQTLG